MTTTTGLAGFLTRGAPADRRTDGELVREYATDGSDVVFAELVRRFAPLVWGVCRRNTGHHQLAEDAFQAAFLILARKAGSVRPSAVGGWLHAVAVHTATRARTVAHRFWKRHDPLATDPVSSMPAEPTDPDTLRALDEEIARLPEHYRAAVVLCELDGMSRREAAKRLGIAEGTLSSRLAVARKTLAARLRGRGVALATALALTSHAGSAGSCRASTPPPVSSTASDLTTTLADGVVRTMFLNKLKRVIAVLAVLVVSILGSVATADPFAPGRDCYQIKAPVPKPEPREGVICIALNGPKQASRLLLMKPDGDVVKEVVIAEKTGVASFALSRDAGRAAVFIPTNAGDKRVKNAANKRKAGWTQGQVAVYDLDKPERATVELDDLLFPVFTWAPDGRTLYLSEIDPTAEGEPTGEGAAYPWVVSTFDTATGKKTRLDLPHGHLVSGVTPDGKTLLTGLWEVSKVHARMATAHLIPLATLKPERVTETTAGPRELSPDGRTFFGFPPPSPGAHAVPVLVDLKEKTETPLKFEKDTAWVQAVKWSPDGKKLLVHRLVETPSDPAAPQANPAPGGGAMKALKAEVAIRHPDGSKPKVVYELKPGEQLVGIDWR